jgi:1,4-dihydroxy-2-naphthoate octaprenyltransferase
MKHWIEASRPKTLIAAILPVVGATVLALSEKQPLNLFLLILALFVSMTLQVATNFWNDYFDFQKGSDTSARLGPQRMLQRGLVKSKDVLKAALIFNALSFLLALPIFWERGFFLVGVGFICLLMTLSYTGGPFPLAYLGLGELFVLIFFGWVACYFSYFVATGVFSQSATVLGLVVGFLSCVLITINNLRDYEEDKKNKKRTLVVLCGRTWGLALLTFELLAPYGLVFYWHSHRLFYLPFFALIFVFVIFKGMAFEKMSSQTNRYLGVAALHALCFLLLWSAGVLLS